MRIAAAHGREHEQVQQTVAVIVEHAHSAGGFRKLKRGPGLVGDQLQLALLIVVQQVFLSQPAIVRDVQIGPAVVVQIGEHTAGGPAFPGNLLARIGHEFAVLL